MLRATGRRAIGSLISRNFNSNGRNGRESSGQEKTDTSENNEAHHFNLEEYIGLQRMIVHSIGIFGSLFVLGFNFHSDCCQKLKHVRRPCPTDINGCSFLHSVYKNLPRLGYPLETSGWHPFTSVLPLHALPGPSSSSSSSLSSASRSEDSSLKVGIEKLCQNLRLEMDIFNEELKNIQASVLLQNNRVEEAVSLLKSCPNSAKAMFNLGIVYESGQHDPIDGQPNYNKALKYYTDAAYLGHSKAYYNLGLIYLYGKHPVKADRSKGLVLLKQAAEMGVEEAVNFMELERLNTINKRHERIRQSEQLFNEMNQKTKNNNNEQGLSKFHTSRSSPNFITSIMTYLRPSINEVPEFEPCLVDEKQSKDDSMYGSNDSLEVIFVQE